MLKLHHNLGSASKFLPIHEAGSSSCQSPLDFTTEWIIIIVCSILGLIWAGVNFASVMKVNVEKGVTGFKDDGR